MLKNAILVQICEGGDGRAPLHLQLFLSSLATGLLMLSSFVAAVPDIWVIASTAVPDLRGIAPTDLEYYDSSTILCRDNSKSFLRERLNDNFCDCTDGTDEPGTSACPESRFYCKSAESGTENLFSSRVNDGICDCCDGSDEYDSTISCLNTCQDEEENLSMDSKKKLEVLAGKLQTKRFDHANRNHNEADLFKAEVKTMLLLEVAVLAALMCWLRSYWQRAKYKPRKSFIIPLVTDH
ncbi:hypothetical protein O6H91_03G090200 [Diphasiastrum complanatum]|uniref:Uncharacterized protein n=1 Tax=Diphasiastrum complanatum TaxID=34168 RepID=A0ACC2E8W2_DIPCM|nr:hypothetical protein O6H91_03G090200 [Diphasiastrum complanatum]